MAGKIGGNLQTIISGRRVRGMNPAVSQLGSVFALQALANSYEQWNGTDSIESLDLQKQHVYYAGPIFLLPPAVLLSWIITSALVS